ncbi:MAG TPA: STAS domain-containing protein [Acidimicrobiia bacterium]|nr:STAS domain-containing protein [Acidimicrobiia bacterium]
MDEPRTVRHAATRPGEHVICPVGELTADTAPAFRTSITHVLLEGTRRIVLDLSSTSRIDRAGRDALVRCARAVRASHATLILRAAPDHVQELFRRSDAQSDAQERLDVELMTDTDEVALQRDRLETDTGGCVCGTFMERTTTGHPLVCVLPLAHAGDHRWR